MLHLVWPYKLASCSSVQSASSRSKSSCLQYREHFCGQHGKLPSQLPAAAAATGMAARDGPRKLPRPPRLHGLSPLACCTTVLQGCEAWVLGFGALDVQLVLRVGDSSRLQSLWIPVLAPGFESSVMGVEGPQMPMKLPC